VRRRSHGSMVTHHSGRIEGFIDSSPEVLRA
jgi:hypothetical protein